MACGASQHRFATCKQKQEPQARKLFCQELWAHVPTTRSRKSDSIPKSVLDADTKCTSIFVAGYHTLQVIYGNQPLKRPSKETMTSQDNNKARWYAIFVRVTNISSSPKNPMPISIHISPPSMCLHLRIPEDDENRM